MSKYIIQKYHDWPFEIIEHDVKNKMVGHQRVSSVRLAPYTEERWEAVQEWNKRLKEWQDFERNFDKRKIGF